MWVLLKKILVIRDHESVLRDLLTVSVGLVFPLLDQLHRCWKFFNKSIFFKYLRAQRIASYGGGKTHKTRKTSFRRLFRQIRTSDSNIF